MSNGIMQKNTVLLSINFIYMAIFSGLTILLPLYMAEKGFELESIGVILAIVPAVFLVVRTLLSVLADIAGTRLIFIVQSIAMAFSVFTYGIANTPLFFSFGKLFEGVSHSGFWSVIRTETYRVAPGTEEKSALYMQGIRNLGDVTGRIFIGIAIFYLSFSSALTGLLVAAIVLAFLSFQMKDKRIEKIAVKQILQKLFMKRGKRFWIVAVIMGLLAIFYSPTWFFLYPLYLKAIGMDILSIGILLAVYSLLSGIAIIYSAKKQWSPRRIALGTIVLGALPFIWINQVNTYTVFLLLGLVALGDGLGRNLFERIIAAASKAGKAVSTDIALLHVPFRATEFLALASMGFLVNIFGYYQVFIGLAAVFALFALTSWAFLKLK